MTHPKTEAVARAIARVIVTRAMRESRQKLDGLGELVAIRDGVEEVWSSLTAEAEAAITALETVPLDG